MPLQGTSGAASQDAFGGSGVAVVPNYIEDVFSTYLYTGTGAAQTVTNGIDLSTKGGMVWLKNRLSDVGALDHFLEDTARGTNKYLSSNTVNQQQDDSAYGGSVTSFNSTGFSLGTATSINYVGSPAATYVSWTFREQPKFFDIVTYTGTGSNTTIAHALGAVPGSIIVKRTDTTAAWAVYHRSLANTQYMVLNTTAAADTGATWWNSTTPTSAVFSVGTDASVNASGGTYVAYLFAHDAGGFGLSGTDNVISCGGYTGNSSTTGPIVTLGYEPQWVLIKRTDAASSWYLHDNMRGMTYESNTSTWLIPNTSAAEVNNATTDAVMPIATGFQIGASGANWNESGSPYIYIAIRRGPMKVPTVGTSVFSPIARTGTGAAATVTGVGFPSDLVLHRARLDNVVTPANMWQDRLRGIQQYLKSNNTNQEFADTAGILTLTMDGMTVGIDSSEGNVNESTATYINYFFRRSPSFFDEVCWTANVTDPTAMTLNHNLGVVPQMMIKKARQTNSVSNSWRVYHVGLNGGVNPQNYVITLNATNAESLSTPDWDSTAPTATQFTAGYVESGYTYVAYLFATLAGVSKVGSYTGTGTTQTINCGFTAGSRFVMIKRTDSTGDWYVWDSARGIVSGNDSYLLLNSTAAEVTSTDYIDTYSAGFEISSTAPAAINANGGTFIFLAIA